MSNNTVDLRQCEEGDILISKHGLHLTYVGPLSEKDYMDHKVKYPDAEPFFGSFGSRTHDGFVFKKKRMPEDHDIVKIVRKKELEEITLVCDQKTILQSFVEKAWNNKECPIRSVVHEKAAAWDKLNEILKQDAGI